jgi:hypothetical protein
MKENVSVFLFCTSMIISFFLVNKNCLWPSRETNSHYTRPIISPSFGATSPFFVPPSTSTLFGQQQAQLWSRFRYAASTLRNDLWLEQTDSNLQQVPSNLFNFTLDQSPMLLPPQTVPTKLMTLQNRTPPSSSSSIDETSSPLFRQRKNTPVSDTIPSTTTTKEDLVTQSSSTIFFTLAIFVIGVVLGCLLTNTFPPGLIWEICVKYFHTIIKSFASFRSA